VRILLARGRSITNPHNARDVEWKIRYTPDVVTREELLAAAGAIADLYAILVEYTSTKDACALVADARRALRGQAAAEVVTVAGEVTP